MHFRQRTRQRIATGLMILFLALALVPIYQILAKLAPGGRFVQLCSSMGIQTVWVADDAEVVRGGLPTLSATATSGDQGASGSLSGLSSKGMNLSSPFGSCEFCWASALATVLPLAFILFVGLPKTRFSPPVYQTQAFHSFLRQWHARPRAPPVFSLI